MSDFYIYSPVHFEEWDWRNSVERGIGGSETCHVELAWRLARRGHRVTSLAPLPDDCPGYGGPGELAEWRGSLWGRLRDADFKAPGTWIILRDAQCLDQMPGPPSQDIWLVCQDESPIGITPERAAKCSRVVALCQWHKQHLERLWPCIKGKVCVSSNGLKVDLIRKVESQSARPRKFAFTWEVAFLDHPRTLARELIAAGHEVHAIVPVGCSADLGLVWSQVHVVPQGRSTVTLAREIGAEVLYDTVLERVMEARAAGIDAVLVQPDALIQCPRELNAHAVRNPHRMIFASSPDRGLLALCKIFRRARELVSDLELHVFYGTNNIEKLIDHAPRFSGYKRFLRELREATDQPGLTWHGRVGQEELYRQMLMSGIWCYPTHFTETSCIQSMEEQALGVIPITRPLAALGENVRHGVFIQGSPDSDALVRARYVAAIVTLATNTDLQERVRAEMVPWARERFDWERTVDQLEGWALGDESDRFSFQWAFQRKHARGSTRLLNLGCGCDPGRISELAATSDNVDVAEQDPVTGVLNKVDLVADARDLPEHIGPYDCAVIGELLEHLGREDRLRVLSEVRRKLVPGGRVVITSPTDRREAAEQHGQVFPPYAPGVPSHHPAPLLLEEVVEELVSSGFRVLRSEELSYPRFTGFGIVAIIEGTQLHLEDRVDEAITQSQEVTAC